MTTVIGKFHIDLPPSSLCCNIYTDKKFEDATSRFKLFTTFDLSNAPSKLNLPSTYTYTFHICSKLDNGAHCHRAYQIKHSAFGDRPSCVFFEIIKEPTSTTALFRSDLGLDSRLDR